MSADSTVSTKKAPISTGINPIKTKDSPWFFPKIWDLRRSLEGCSLDLVLVDCVTSDLHQGYIRPQILFVKLVAEYWLLNLLTCTLFETFSYYCEPSLLQDNFQSRNI